MTEQAGTRTPTPVNLLTGFLGSGKTTLLQRLLTDPGLAGAAVLINEFGEVGLDHHLLERIDDDVVLLTSGCICCTVRGEVADALLGLYDQRARGDIPWFDRVVIETTGLADPYPALSTIRAHPVLKSQFILGNVVTTVDAVNAAAATAGRLEAVRQIAAADILAVTKTDLCDAATAAATRERLRAMNPTARILAAGDPEISELLRRPAQLLPEGPAGDLAAADAPAGQDGVATWQGDEDHIHDHYHDGELHHHHAPDDAHAVRSFALTFAERVDWTGFGIWLTMLLNRHGDRIFRVKGILDVEGEDTPVAVHAVQRLVHPPVHMAAWPTAERGSRIVFIVEGLDPARIERSWRVFNGLSARVLGRTPAMESGEAVRA